MPATDSHSHQTAGTTSGAAGKHRAIAGWPGASTMVPVAAILALVAMILFCYGRTLSSYYLADDFGEISYLHKIFNGDARLFWSNFTGNYMQIPGMSVYRPWLLVSLAADYLIWGANAFGYYLTNIIMFALDSILLFLLVRRLTNNWDTVRSNLASFFTAAIFAAYPLHCESVSWVVGRVDIACCFYYLLSLYLFTRHVEFSRRTLLAGSLICFLLALFTKEMAIGLPVMVSAIAFFQADRAGTRKITERLKRAAALSFPYWSVTVLYFLIRYLALGTLVGGYTGGIGASQVGNILAKWTDADTFARLFYPLNFSVFHGGGIYLNLLSGIYFLVAVNLSMRLLTRDWPVSWLCIGAFWLASAAAPIFQLWGLGYNLEGSRFVFFLTVPVSVLFAVFAFAPSSNGVKSNSKVSGRMLYVNALTMSALVFTFARATNLNNVPWVHAGKTVRAVQRSAIQLAASTAKDKPLVMLGIPKEEGGAHMILNGATFSMMLSKPFSQFNLAQRFLTFDPPLFGNSDLINATRFKQIASSGQSGGVYVWQPGEQNFKRVSFDDSVESVQPDTAAGRANELSTANKQSATQWSPCTANGATFQQTPVGLRLDNASPGDGLKIAALNLSPLAVDYAVVTVSDENEPMSKVRARPEPIPGSGGQRQMARQSLQATWHGASGEGSTESVAVPLRRHAGENVTVTIPLSHYWRWYAAGTIDSIAIRMSKPGSLTVRDVRFINSSSISPSWTLEHTQFSTRGVIESLSPGAAIHFDGSRIAASESIEVQVSKPNFFFDQEDELIKSHSVWRRLSLAGNQPVLPLAQLALPEHAYYQLRARSLDCAGRPLGDWSDAVTIHF